MNTAADVTDLNVAQQKLQESERTLRNLILQAPVAMCIFRGKDYIVEIANDRMLEIWGKSAEEVINKSTFEANPEGRGQGYEQILENILTTGERFTIDEMPTTLLRKGKMEDLYVNLRYEPIRESDGSVSGILVVAIEVTEQVLARLKIEEVVAQRTKELAEANKTLQHNNRELEQFAYIASHDLQEPLRKVSTFTEMLKTNLGDIDERSKTYLSKISTSSLRMMQLIRDVLDFSQISNEREVFELVDLSNIVESIISDFELVIEQKGATINYNHLPAVKGIPLQMRQLFSNLLSNALKFTQTDVPPVITLTAQRLSYEEMSSRPGLLQDTPYFIITVKDNGIGFEQQHAEKIFGIFQRLHGKTEYAGTGIGLALCKKIAQNHHGEIWATSNSDTGTTFHIILPENQTAHF
jgi:PAS domain S-box-containing protein